MSEEHSKVVVKELLKELSETKAELEEALASAEQKSSFLEQVCCVARTVLRVVDGCGGKPTAGLVPPHS